jgi:hypothetical protein
MRLTPTSTTNRPWEDTRAERNMLRTVTGDFRALDRTWKELSMMLAA